MLKITLEKNQKLWFFSDPHYSHKNICRGTTNWRTQDGEIPIEQTRNFGLVDEMNDRIINNLNYSIDQDDIAICLGDWSFGGFENIQKFRDRIICRNIYLITGNHDQHILNNRDNIRSIFSGINEHYTQLDVLIPKGKEHHKEHLILSHFPICSWENMNKGWIHLFGHVHLPPHKKMMAGRSMDVGMDGNNFEPYSLTEINSLLKNKPIKHTSLPEDHHEERLKT